MTLTLALQRLWNQNQEEGRPQRRTRTAPLKAGVPTLAKGITRPASPQLLERFAFAGTWRSALLGQTWLSESRMRQAWNAGTLREQVEVREKYWDNSILTIESAERVTLFALDQEDNDETYLVWKGEKEPRVLLYSGHSETWYPDLLRFVTAFLGDGQR